MNGHGSRAILRALTVFFLYIFVLTFFHAGQGRAQSTPPTVIDFWIAEEQLFLEVSLNAEALLVGLYPTQHQALLNDPQYQSLREMTSSDFEPLIKGFVENWVQDVEVEVPERLALSYAGARVPDPGEVETARVSIVYLTAPLEENASNLRLRWPTEGGPIVLRQQGVTAPYTGYLTAGESSPLIPLRGGASLTPQQTLQTYFALGLNRFTQAPFAPCLLAACLAFLSLSLRPVAVQVVFLSAGVFLGLGLAVYGVLNPITYLPVQAPPVFIIILALWNLVARRLQVSRLLTVFAAGTVFGLGLATALKTIGVPPDHQLPAMLGFGAGVVFPLIFTASAAFGLALLLAGGSHRARGRISALASILIAGLGVYWLAEPWMLG